MGILGEGMFSLVYDAKDILLNHTVSIKTVKKDLLKDNPQCRAIFFREAKYLASLVYPTLKGMVQGRYKCIYLIL